MEQTSKFNGSLCRRFFYHGCIDTVVFLAIIVVVYLSTLLFFDQVPFPSSMWYHKLSIGSISKGEGQILLAYWILISLLIGLVIFHLVLASLICYNTIIFIISCPKKFRNSPVPFLDQACCGLFIFFGFVFPFIIAFCFAAKSFFQKDKDHALVPASVEQFKKYRLILFSSYLMVTIANAVFVGLPLSMIYLEHEKPSFNPVNCKRFYQLSNTGRNLLYFHFRGIDTWRVEEILTKNTRLRSAFKDFTIYQNHLALTNSRLGSLPYSLFGHNGNIFEKPNLRTPLKQISLRKTVIGGQIDFPGSCLINVSDLSLGEYYKLCLGNFVAFWNYLGFDHVNVCNFPYFGKQDPLQIYPNNTEQINHQIRDRFEFKNFTAVSSSELQNYRGQRANYNNLDDAYVLSELIRDWKIGNETRGAFSAFFSQQNYGKVCIRNGQNNYRRSLKCWDKTLLTSIEDTFLDLSEILNFLAKNNVYENTTIVIVSDHGFSTRNRAGKFSKEYISGFAPIFMIKPWKVKQSELVTNTQTLITNADELNWIRKLLFPLWSRVPFDPLSPYGRFGEHYSFFENYPHFDSTYDNKTWSRNLQIFRLVDERYFWWRKKLKITGVRSFSYKPKNVKSIFSEDNWSSEII